jgi:hypothetical protein
VTARDRILLRVSRLVAELGDLRHQVTIVGGTSPALYRINNTVSLRPTADVDLILPSTTRMAWYQFVGALEDRGFSYPAGEPMCRYVKGDLIVDVLPIDADQLGFTNRWYAEAAKARVAAHDVDMHVVSPIYFLATKLDAFEGRGIADPYTSQDLEDIFVVLRGLPDLLGELTGGQSEAHREIRRQLGAIARRPDALDVVRAQLEPDAATQAIAPSLLARVRQACGVDVEL